jgi:hypothetical protein
MTKVWDGVRHFIWLILLCVADKHSMARELLYQFMVKYDTVLTETDVKDLKREVRGYKGMDEVFAKGWLSPQSEVNV